jgi:hypothetical protein
LLTRLSFQILGNAGRDNALLVTVDSGQAVSKLHFDCGDGCLWQLPFGAVQEIDQRRVNSPTTAFSCAAWATRSRPC